MVVPGSPLGWVGKRVGRKATQSVGAPPLEQAPSEAARPASRAADGEQVFMWQMPVPPQRERKGSMAATKAAGVSSIGV